MAGIDLKLNAGSFTGAIFPVNLDVAYSPDRVDTSTSINGTALMFYDESVVEVVPGSLTTGGVHTPGTGIISWPLVKIPESGTWAKLSAQFQWIDYNEGDTWFSGAFNSRSVGLVAAPPLEVARPGVARGTKLKASS